MAVHIHIRRGSRSRDAEKFSFTNPNVPLFGKEYQETKRKAEEAMENLRKIMEQGKRDGHLTGDAEPTATKPFLRHLAESMNKASAEKSDKPFLQLFAEAMNAASEERRGQGK